MPELPEAQNIANALNRVLPGRKILRVETFSKAMRTSLEPLNTAGLAGRTFTGVRRRARYLIADLDDGRGLLMHFGMSGVVRVEDHTVPRRKHEHIFLHLDDGRIFRFECTRRFSLMEICQLTGPDRLPERLQTIGPEPFSDAFCVPYLLQAAAGKKTAVKSFLMDNAVVAGIGNIYVTETLFASGIHPLRRAESILSGEWELIISHSRRILKRAIELGGSSISDFLNVDGSEGKFAQELLVYGKAGECCPVCNTILQMVRIGGRSSCFCPECQK